MQNPNLSNGQQCEAARRVRRRVRRRGGERGGEKDQRDKQIDKIHQQISVIRSSLAIIILVKKLTPLRIEFSRIKT
jgi:hypothetical protein